MTNSYTLGLAAIAASLSLIGCGSSSDSDSTSTVETVTGQFVDTYVAGLNYACSSGTTGVTNNIGEYTCNVGDTVEFSLGKYVLGSTTASSGIVTPEVLYPDNPEAALNVAQVIQSLDADPTDDIITIPENFTGLDDVTTTPEDENFDALIEDVLDVPLVTEEEAQAHLDETELMLLLAGKTFYNVGSDWIDRSVFNADLTSVTWEQIVGDNIGETGTDTLLLDNGQLIVTSGEDGSSFRVAIAEVTTDYLLISLLDSNGAVVEQNRLYFEQVTAEAYYDSLQPDLATLIVGNTKYFVNSQGVIGYRTYAEDGTYTGSVTLAGGSPFDVSGTYAIVGDVLTITRTSPSDFLTVLTYTGEEDGGLAFNITVNGGEEFQTISFETAAERDAYIASLQPDLAALTVGNTKYFATSLGATGYRTYAEDGTYTGSVTLAGGSPFDVSGTYAIVGDVLTITRTSPSSVLIVLTYKSYIDGVIGMDGTVNGGEVFQTFGFNSEAERDAYVASLQPDLAALMVGNTKYFANSLGATGHRTYAEDGTYTGSVTLAGGSPFDVSGTYAIVDDVLTITRTSGQSDVLIVLTYKSYIDGVIGMDGTVNGGAVFQTFEFNSEAERDAFAASLQPV